MLMCLLRIVDSDEHMLPKPPLKIMRYSANGPELPVNAPLGCTFIVKAVNVSLPKVCRQEHSPVQATP